MHTFWTILRDFGLTIAAGCVLIFVTFGLIDAVGKLRKALRLRRLNREARKERRSPEVINDQLWNGKACLDRAIKHQKEATLAGFKPITMPDLATGAHRTTGEEPTGPQGLCLDGETYARLDRMGLGSLAERGR